MNIKEQAISGVKWTTFSSIINAILSFIQFIALSRILNPSDFGLMALVMVVIGFSQMFIDMGISNAIIYTHDVSTNQLNSLYWLNIFTGVILFLVIFLISQYIADFYKEPKLNKLIFYVGLTFLIQPFGQQFLILLKKNLQFENIAKAQIIAKFISFIFIICLALLGFGVYSLVMGVIVSSTISTIVLIYYGFKIYTPKFYFQKSDIKRFIGFGIFQMGEKMIQYFNTQLDTILIGKFLGVENLGVYNLAKQLLSYPSQIINPTVTNVTFPVMAKFNNDINKLKQVYSKTINYLSLINFPIYLLISILAESLVLTFFGVKWLEAIPIIQIMSITSLINSTGNPAGSLLLSRGRADIAFYWNLILLFIIPLSIYIGSFWAINGIVFAALLIQIIIFLPIWKFVLFKIINITLVDYLKLMFVPLLLIIFTGLSTFLFLFFIQSIILKLAFGPLFFGIIYFILLRRFQFEFYIELKSLFSGLYINRRP